MGSEMCIRDSTKTNPVVRGGEIGGKLKQSNPLIQLADCGLVPNVGCRSTGARNASLMMYFTW